MPSAVPRILLFPCLGEWPPFVEEELRCLKQAEFKGEVELEIQEFRVFPEQDYSHIHEADFIVVDKERHAEITAVDDFAGMAGTSPVLVLSFRDQDVLRSCVQGMFREMISESPSGLSAAEAEAENLLDGRKPITNDNDSGD